MPYGFLFTQLHGNFSLKHHTKCSTSNIDKLLASPVTAVSAVGSAVDSTSSIAFRSSQV